LENGNTTFIVVGTGGYELTHGLHHDPHVLELSGENFGYVNGREFKILP